MPRLACCLGFAWLLIAIAEPLPLSAQSPDSVDFFEKRIRPVLVQHCYECHSSSADEIGGSLLLDSSSGMMLGGDSGPAIDPGNVDGSMLISAIRYESSEMPPAGKLPDEVVEDFEAWIKAGARDPRQTAPTPKVGTSAIDLEAGRQFWSFQPIRASAVPPIQGPEVQTWIDAYLSDSLHQSGLQYRQLAPAATRLRRLAFDLTGLPPTLQQQEAWLKDPSPAHWRRIVDSMLASPAFAQHWARHWMDVARYADSNGSDFNATHHEAWRYRDYLIRSFAADRPFDRMVHQQVAGDLLPAQTDQQRRDNVVASTFLMLGTKMLSERDKTKLILDVVDEQIDTVGRAFMGLTLGCARCHDHKFDPVPTEDYYALAGIFKNTITLNGESQKYVSTWNRVPLPVSQERRDEIAAYQAKDKSLREQLAAAEKALVAAQKSESQSLAGIVVDDADATRTGSWTASTYYKHFVGTGYVHDNNRDKGAATITFRTRLPKAGRYEVRVSHSPGSGRARAVPVTIKTAEGSVTRKMDQRANQIGDMWSSLGTFALTDQADTTVTLSNEGTSGYVIADAVQFLPETPAKLASNADDAEDKAKQKAAAEIETARQRVQQLKDSLTRLEKNKPDPLPEAMAPSDRPSSEITDSRVHIRGEARNLGETVPRGFLQVCGAAGPAARSSSANRFQGSGRLELAEWLTDPDHPLTARVFVNRVWMHLMGEGIVRTVDNFGFQGQRPTHPELLDALAIDFIRKGWRLKPLIRQIVTSHAYQQSSAYDRRADEIDPENRLLWRMHRRRIPAEAIRDAMVMATGSLDRTGRREPMADRGTLVSNNNGDSKASFDHLGQPCRSIYLPVVRSYVPALMQKLDAADPDLLVGKRPTTNVPAQALVLINSPEVNRWAEKISQRVMESEEDYQGRLMLLYRICLQRPPSEDDRRIAEQHFAKRREAAMAWHQYVAAVLAGTEFRLLD